MNNIKIESSYLTVALDPSVSQVTIDTLVNLIRVTEIDFDTIVFRGMSGALIAPIVAHRLGKPLTICRKQTDDSHSGHNQLEGMVNFHRYIIIDDMIVTGNTIQHIIETVNRKFSSDDNFDFTNPKCVGIFLYRYDPYTDMKDFRHSYHIPVFGFRMNLFGDKEIDFCDEVTSEMRLKMKGLDNSKINDTFSI